MALRTPVSSYLHPRAAFLVVCLPPNWRHDLDGWSRWIYTHELRLPAPALARLFGWEREEIAKHGSSAQRPSTLYSHSSISESIHSSSSIYDTYPVDLDENEVIECVTLDCRLSSIWSLRLCNSIPSPLFRIRGTASPQRTLRILCYNAFAFIFRFLLRLS